MEIAARYECLRTFPSLRRDGRCRALHNIVAQTAARGQETRGQRRKERARVQSTVYRAAGGYKGPGTSPSGKECMDAIAGTASRWWRRATEWTGERRLLLTFDGLATNASAMGPFSLFFRVGASDEWTCRASHPGLTSLHPTCVAQHSGRCPLSGRWARKKRTVHARG